MLEGKIVAKLLSETIGEKDLNFRRNPDTLARGEVVLMAKWQQDGKMFVYSNEDLLKWRSSQKNRIDLVDRAHKMLDIEDVYPLEFAPHRAAKEEFEDYLSQNWDNPRMV